MQSLGLGFHSQMYPPIPGLDCHVQPTVLIIYLSTNVSQHLRLVIDFEIISGCFNIRELLRLSIITWYLIAGTSLPTVHQAYDMLDAALKDQKMWEEKSTAAKNLLARLFTSRQDSQEWQKHHPDLWGLSFFEFYILEISALGLKITQETLVSILVPALTPITQFDVDNAFLFPYFLFCKFLYVWKHSSKSGVSCLGHTFSLSNSL